MLAVGSQYAVVASEVSSPSPLHRFIALAAKGLKGSMLRVRLRFCRPTPTYFLVCRRRRICIIHKDPKPTRPPLGLTNEVGLSLAESTASAKTVGWPRSLPYGQRPLRVPCLPVPYLCLHYFVVAEEKNRCLPNPVNCNAVFFVSSVCIQSLRNSHIYWPFCRIPTFRQTSRNESVVRVAMKVIIFLNVCLVRRCPWQVPVRHLGAGGLLHPPSAGEGGGCFAVSPIFQKTYYPVCCNIVSHIFFIN